MHTNVPRKHSKRLDFVFGYDSVKLRWRRTDSTYAVQLYAPLFCTLLSFWTYLLVQGKLAKPPNPQAIRFEKRPCH